MVGEIHPSWVSAPLGEDDLFLKNDTIDRNACYHVIARVRFTLRWAPGILEIFATSF